MQDLAGAGRAAHPARKIEAVKLEFNHVRRIGVVFPHPFHEFPIRVDPAKAVAESGLPHFVIRCRAAAMDVVIHQAPARETAFDGDGAVAMRFDQPLKELVSQDENILPAVERFPEAE
jgi:hypothetical protein